MNYSTPGLAQLAESYLDHRFAIDKVLVKLPTIKGARLKRMIGSSPPPWHAQALERSLDHHVNVNLVKGYCGPLHPDLGIFVRGFTNAGNL